MEIYLSSDYHFGHSNILKYSKRPFSDVEEMNDAIINNHNSVVKPDDVLFFLGDFAFCDARRANEFLGRMNGHKILVIGNHDFKLRDKFVGFKEIWDQKSLELAGQWFFLNHYAMRSWDKQHYGSIQCHGHSHGNLPDSGLKQVDVGIDTHKYFPYHIDEIIEKFKDYKSNVKINN